MRYHEYCPVRIDHQGRATPTPWGHQPSPRWSDLRFSPFRDAISWTRFETVNVSANSRIQTMKWTLLNISIRLILRPSNTASILSFETLRLALQERRRATQELDARTDGCDLGRIALISIQNFVWETRQTPHNFRGVQHPKAACPSSQERRGDE